MDLALLWTLENGCEFSACSLGTSEIYFYVFDIFDAIISWLLGSIFKLQMK